MNIKCSIKEAIGYLTIDRPKSLNALNGNVLDEFIKEIKSLVSNDNVRVIIITGAGDKAFIAGADIKLMQNMDEQAALVFANKGHELTGIIENSKKPVIAAIHGYALGGGSEIALACHLRISSDESQFAQPEVKIGLLPGWGGTQRLPRVVGKGIANELILTGNNISAERAYEVGLINKIVTKSDLMPTCVNIAKQIINNSPNAISESIKLINTSSSTDLKKGLELESNKFSELFKMKETHEGLSAFVEKRKPNY